MPCHAAMSKDAIKLKMEMSVEEALKALAKKKADAAPVVDKDGVFQGLFTVRNLFKNLLPVSVAMADGIQLDVNVSAAPGAAKRLNKVKPLPLQDFLVRRCPRVAPGTPLWEGLQMIVQEGGPLVVVDPDSGKLLGHITEASMMEEVERMNGEGA
jgi:CBS-domain-containing membrane protein